MRTSLPAMLLGLGLSACTHDVTRDTDTPTDASADDGLSVSATCGESRIDFTYQFPDGEVRSGCVGIVRGVLVGYDRDDAGACHASATSVSGSSDDYVLNLGTATSPLFDSVGTVAIGVQFQVVRGCDFDAGTPAASRSRRREDRERPWWRAPSRRRACSPTRRAARRRPPCAC